jgi:7-cyano-7-deazaguanine synthase
MESANGVSGPSLAPGTAPALAILVSGGLDSAILLGESLRNHPTVYPLYIRNGLYWETEERHFLRRFLEAVRTPVLQPLHVLNLPVADLYRDHWSITGANVPDAQSADEAVFLPGRNVLLLAKALVWCHLHQAPALALATLEANPFPDATASFFAAYQAAVNQAVGGAVEVFRPYSQLTKTEVLRRGRGLPLHLTFSCIGPAGGRHCGACNKCTERQKAFAEAGMVDPTEYAVEPTRRARER